MAILFDASGSMTQKGRWEEVQRIALTWLDHLDVDECVLIVFSSGVATFPADGSLLRVSGPDGAASRARLLEYLRSVKPEGWTNTLAAMQQAYRYPVDTIILFSDGADLRDHQPLQRPSGRADLCPLPPACRHPDQRHRTGQLLRPDFSTFLRTTAQLTGGTFVGR